MKKPGEKKRGVGRPAIHEGGSANVNAYLAAGMAKDLTRYAASLTVANGKRHSVSEVILAAVEAYRPFQEWRRKQRGAPG
jgi:hypothetical protein